MSDNFERFKNCAVEVLAVDASAVTTEASFADDLDADSLDLVELVMALEEEFDITVEEEELSLPHTRRIWVGSDATLDVMGAVDWTGRCYYRADVSPFYNAVVAAVGGSDQQEIIAVAELLGFFCYCWKALERVAELYGYLCWRQPERHRLAT